MDMIWKGEDLEKKEKDIMSFNVTRGRFWYKKIEVIMLRRNKRRES